jgi:hypothetical protein
VGLQPLENKALSWGIIGKAALILAEITVRKSQSPCLADYSHSRCGELITSAALLDYIARFQLELCENGGHHLLELTENVLGFAENNLITSAAAGIN